MAADSSQSFRFVDLSDVVGLPVAKIPFGMGMSFRKVDMSGFFGTGNSNGGGTGGGTGGDAQSVRPTGGQIFPRGY